MDSGLLASLGPGMTESKEQTMANAGNSNGIIAVDKMGGKVLFLNPVTYATEVVIDGFP